MLVNAGSMSYDAVRSRTHRKGRRGLIFRTGSPAIVRWSGPNPDSCRDRRPRLPLRASSGTSRSVREGAPPTRENQHTSLRDGGPQRANNRGPAADSSVGLPTYAPWLNRIEKLWRYLRQEVLHLHQEEDFGSLHAHVNTFLDQFAGGSQHLLRYVGLLQN